MLLKSCCRIGTSTFSEKGAFLLQLRRHTCWSLQLPVKCGKFSCLVPFRLKGQGARAVYTRYRLCLGSRDIGDMDDEYAKFIRRMNPPRVVIDNDSSEDATIIQVDSVNEHGILLQVIQILTDLNLVITKACISSDGGWFMDVFNVTDQVGNKVRDEEIINYIQKTLENDEVLLPSLRGTVGLVPSEDHTSIELSGTDRPGLLSEVFAVLADLHCNVVNAAIWTHNARAAAVVHVVDDVTDCAIEDPKRLATIKKLLHNVLKGNNDLKTAKMTLSPPGDYVKVRKGEQGKVEDLKSGPCITVYDCSEKDYTLLFDIVCTLTDMQYVVFHGVVHTGKMEAYQEFYIRHVDGLPISSEAERDGLELELGTEDRLGLLSDITRIFRENSLCIKRAEISTEGGKAKDIFYVTDVTGNPVDQKTVDSIHEVRKIDFSGINGSVVAVLVVHGLCSGSRLAEAVSSFDELKVRECKPDFIAYSIVAETLGNMRNVVDKELV
ncbi:hypothetical protein K7X08_019097 [Anisodus acutangulus]|uniref:ACT domain-containing protein ACR n=1 Tax=Anisodus acutangulus TaxID=402998 RepID=A0A9Q1MV49_9SOLA|nr:hypothetical protein K7X08_019097 [Anisodus acutangulus]